MICDECYEKVKKDFIGNGYKDGAVINNVLRHSPNAVYIKNGQFLSYTPDFKLIMCTERKLKNGKIKVEDRVATFNSAFCPNCGKNIAF